MSTMLSLFLGSVLMALLLPAVLSSADEDVKCKNMCKADSVCQLTCREKREDTRVVRREKHMEGMESLCRDALALCKSDRLCMCRLQGIVRCEMCAMPAASE